MMKRRIFAILLALSMVLASSGISFATTTPYKYRVTIYAGEQGHFTKGKEKVWEKEFSAGERVSVSLEKTLGFSLDNDKYYVRGLRITGHDNDETTGAMSLNFSAQEDVSYEIAYGIKGALVAYRVEYLDEDGNELYPTETFYGMPGDKPVVAYQYIEDYQPNTYYIGGTLTEDEDSNVFTFVYTPLNGVDQTQQPQAPAAPGTPANPAGTAVAAAPGNAAAAGNADGNAGANAGDDGTTNISDGDTPLAEGPTQYEDIDDNETPLAESVWNNPVLLVSGAAGLLLLAIILWLLAKRKKKEDEEEPLEG